MQCPRCNGMMIMDRDDTMLRYDCSNRDCNYAFAAIVGCGWCLYNKTIDDKNEYFAYCKHCRYNPNNDNDNFKSQ